MIKHSLLTPHVIAILAVLVFPLFAICVARLSQLLMDQRTRRHR
jgi:hypothetical protein